MLDTEGLPWRFGAKAGAVAWTLGFVVFGLLVTVTSVTGGSSAPLSIFRSAIIFFLAAHGWPLLLAAAAQVPVVPVLFLPVPAMLLFTAGYRTVYGTDIKKRRPAYRAGMTVIAGYAPLTVLALLVLVPFATGLTSVVVYLIIFLFTGLIVPALAGGFGGIIAAR